MKETMKNALLWTAILFMVVGNGNAMVVGPNGDTFYTSKHTNGFVNQSGGGITNLLFDDGAGNFTSQTHAKYR